jgi:Kef-type K+ transport system membrane component KefB
MITYVIANQLGLSVEMGCFISGVSVSHNDHYAQVCNHISNFFFKNKFAGKTLINK